MTRIKDQSRSTLVVRLLQEADTAIRARGFRESVLGILGDAKVSFLPDAFAVREEIRTIDMIEVVDTNPIMRHKAAKITALALALLDEGWNLTVVGYDACGGLMFELPGTAFSEIFIAPLMGDEQGNTIPAAMAAARQAEEMPMEQIARLWRSIP